MEIRVLNTSFIALDILEGVDSILWTEKYNEYGSFEIYTKYSDYHLALLQEDYYLINSDSEKVMIIESVNITIDPELGDKLIVKGRSLESILDRRIVLRQIILDTVNLQSGIQTVLNKEIISGIFTERNIPNFIFLSSVDPLVTTPIIKTSYYFENVYDIITNLCSQQGIGFRVTLNSSNQFVFNLYAGLDRSYAQLTNPFVIFSPKFDNLVKSDYFRTKEFRKNYIFVAGDTGAIDWNLGFYGRWAQAWTDDVGTGLGRRETYLDLSSLQSQYEDGSPVPDDLYVDALYQRGLEELENHPIITNFDGEVDLSRMYIYRTDFFLGDIIQLVDSYGHSASVRIEEITMSENTSGFSIHPTLKTL